jgi:hypothetical protein
VKRVLDLTWLQEWEFEQFLDRRGRELTVLLDRQRTHAVAGLGRDNDARSTARDDLAEFLQQQRRAVEIDLQDGFDGGLRGGDARSLNEPGHLAHGGCRSRQIFNGPARRDIDGCRPHIETGVAQRLCRSVGILLA